MKYCKTIISVRKAMTLVGVACAVCSCGEKVQERQVDNYIEVTQQGGPTLGYSAVSGIKLLTVDGHVFKDLNRNDSLDRYEDWRLTAEERAADLATQLSVEEIAGLMLYSSHQMVLGDSLTEAQQRFLSDDHVRAVLITRVANPETAARWNNRMQAFVEGVDHGIPSNTSSDPRHETRGTLEFNAGAGGQISLWPSSLGMAATFDPALVRRFGEIASEEYRALGITTALSPQIDITTEPRWWRYNGNFGEDVQLTIDMARAYCDGFQTTPASLTLDGKAGWGRQSVNAMVKHWYGYGAQEAGRDSHFANGKFAVYPGNNLAMHKRPFTAGAFRLEGGTEKAAAVMPVYSILWNQNPSGENVAGGYSKWLIQQQLRDEAKYDGVVCTDWGITADCTDLGPMGGGKPWGVEKLTVAERHYRILQAGVDQFGGNNEIAPILEAYQMWSRDRGEASARERFEQSARRLLLNIFRTGLFENPYLAPAQTAATVGKPEFMQEGYDCQLKSVVMLKNHTNLLPLTSNHSPLKKVWLPMRHDAPLMSPWGPVSGDTTICTMNRELVGKYFEVVDTPEEADFAICHIREPYLQLGHSNAEGYVPITLQYGPYTATAARSQSMAGGDPLENTKNRSYRGKTVTAQNIDHMRMVLDTREKMGEKPVVLIVEVSKPVVLGEMEPSVDAILLSFGAQQQALLDIISGKAEPSWTAAHADARRYADRGAESGGRTLRPPVLQRPGRQRL